MERKPNKLLQECGNKNPFTVPENYFEEFAAGMDARVTSNQVTLKRLVKPWMYMAAMFVGLFLMGNVFYSIYQQNRNNDTDLYEMYLTSQIDQSVVFDYYEAVETVKGTE